MNLLEFSLQVHVRIQSRKGVLYEGDAHGVTGYNEKGIFDILPNHSNFISVIRDKVVVYEASKQKKEVPVGKAVLKVAGNKVNIYLIG